MNTTPQSRFLRALTTRITIFSYSAASDGAYNGMALNNGMPLYPQMQPPGPHSHPSGKHKERECWIKRQRAQGSCCSLWLMSHVTLAKVISQLLHSLSLSEKTEKLDKPENLSESFQFLVQFHKHLQKVYMCCSHC